MISGGGDEASTPPAGNPVEYVERALSGATPGNLDTYLRLPGCGTARRASGSLLIQHPPTHKRVVMRVSICPQLSLNSNRLNNHFRSSARDPLKRRLPRRVKAVEIHDEFKPAGRRPGPPRQPVATCTASGMFGAQLHP